MIEAIKAFEAVVGLEGTAVVAESAGPRNESRDSHVGPLESASPTTNARARPALRFLSARLSAPSDADLRRRPE